MKAHCGHSELIHSPKYQKSGFTIVELLIVIVVIAILAAISIVAYNGIQSRARASAASSAASQAAKKIALFQVENSTYPLSGNLNLAGISNSNSVNYQYTSNGSSYCLTASNGGISYKVNDINSTPQAGSCSGQIDGGMITNLHPNPGAVSTTGYSSYAGLAPNVSSLTSVSAPWSTSESAVRATWTNGTTTTQGDLGIYVNHASITPGNTYTLRYQILARQTSNISGPGIWATTGVYSILASSAGATSFVANTPVARWVTFTGDAAALGSGLRIVQTPTIATGYGYEISDVIIYPGPHNPSIGFGWGGSSGWTWNGAANNSTSSGPIL